MDQRLYQNHLNILRRELIPAMGCTEPVAIALAAAKAGRLLSERPERMLVECSKDIIKNVKGATVPNSGGMKGIDAAAVLGLVGGDPDADMQVLESVSAEHLQTATEWLASGLCESGCIETAACLHIRVSLFSAEHSVVVEISHRHNHVSLMMRDGVVVSEAGTTHEADLDPIQNEADNPHCGSICPPGRDCSTCGPVDDSLLTIRNILTFAEAVQMEDVREIIGRQIACNSAISAEGLLRDWGVNVGRTLMDSYGDNVRTRARARAAAASDARMSGCAMPVVVNSGSGNQGITVSLPIIEYAAELKADEERLMRALVVGNLVAVRLKREFGRLSAFCGAVSAAAGCGAGIAWLHDTTPEVVESTIINTIANVGGMVCDGAKPSCAAKISSAIDATLMAFEMSRQNRSFAPGDGLVKADVEQTIACVGRMGREGMRETDEEIIRLMMG